MRRRGAIVLILAAVAMGCTTLLASKANAPVAMPAPPDLAEAARLDIAIVVFDPGLPEDGKLPERVFPNIRQAESKVFPQHLRTTLQQTGHWGLVAIVPAAPTSTDVTVTGKVHHSDGQRLLLDIRASDSSGREWLDKTYKVEPTDAAYDDEEHDPYQTMFNTIANDLVAKRARLSADELEDIATITDLRFASRLAPDAFEGYLESRDGEHYTIRRLPAIGDPMLERALQVKQRDEMFIGALDVHYENFTAMIQGSYRQWRDSAREESRARAALAREQKIRAFAAVMVAAATVMAAQNGGSLGDAAIAGGAIVIAQQVKQIQQLGQEKQFHEEALAELDESFAAEVRPMVIELEGTTVRLTGTAEAQYAEWQRLLAQLYQAETGMVSAIWVEVEEPALDVDAEEPIEAETESTLPPVSAPANLDH